MLDPQPAPGADGTHQAADTQTADTQTADTQEAETEAAAEAQGGLKAPTFDPKQRESETAQIIAITLLCMLGGTVLLHYVTLIVLTVKCRTDAIPHFEQMFSVWTPLLSGLVGSAVTFYLTKEKK